MKSIISELRQNYLDTGHNFYLWKMEAELGYIDISIMNEVTPAQEFVEFRTELSKNLD